MPAPAGKAHVNDAIGAVYVTQNHLNKAISKFRARGQHPDHSLKAELARSLLDEALTYDDKRILVHMYICTIDNMILIFL